MKPKPVLKILIDVLMMLTLLFLTGVQFWGDEAHEWAGIGIFVLFTAHHILNGHWYKNMFKGRCTALRTCGIVIDALMLAAVIALMYSGIVMSLYIFALSDIIGSITLARRLHILAFYWGFILISMHLGLHWNMIMSMAKKSMKRIGPSRIRSALLFLAGFLTAGYGVYAFIKRGFPTYLFLRSEFVYMDYGESKLMFYLDYLALMGAFVFVVRYVATAVKVIKKQKNI